MEKVEFEKQLLEAIKKDDVKSFSFLMPTNADLNLCYGRFPILSLLYLYSSYKILARFEKYLMPIHNYKITNEPIEIYKKFRVRVKKSLRFFDEEKVVYPILMLAILDEKYILRKNYELLYKNVEIIENLNKIYNLNHNLKIIQNDTKIKIQEKNLTKSNYILSSVVSFVCCLLIILTSVCMVFVSKENGLGTKNNPIQISTASEFIKALKNGTRFYNLNDDIEISTDFQTKNFAGTIYGNGHKVKLVGDSGVPIIKNLSGSLINLNFFVDENKIKITQNGAIIAENLSGNIENCDINGNFSLEFAGTEALYFGLFASTCSGKLNACSISISAVLQNTQESDAYFGGFIGVNEESGQILNCVSDCGVVQADTVDMSGIACENNGKIYSCVNKMQLSQTSSKEWHPNVAGISIKNNGEIESCENQAELLSESTLSVAGKDESGEEYSYSVIVGGIACENYGKIVSSENSGSILGQGIVSGILASGIATINYGTIESCKNHGEIQAESTRTERGKDTNGDEYFYYVIAGGVSANNYNSISDSRNYGQINSRGNVSNVISGGIVAQNSTSTSSSGVVQNSLSKNKIIANSETGQVCVGGVAGVNSSIILSCGFVGNIEADTNSTEDEQIFTYQVEKALVLFAGGVVGLNRDSMVRNCYAEVNYSVITEPEGVRKLQAGVIGMVGIIQISNPPYYNATGLSYVSSNYYVKSSQINYGGFGIQAMVSVNGSSIAYDSGVIYNIQSTSNMLEVGSLNDIPAGVVIDE